MDMQQANDNTTDDNTEKCIQVNDTTPAPLKTDPKGYGLY